VKSSVSRDLKLRALNDFPLVHPGDDLADLIVKVLQKNHLTLLDGDIIVIAQKVVSKAEGRQVQLDGVNPSERAKSLAVKTGKDPRVVELVLQESSEVLRYRQGLIVVEHRLGFVCANAGIDRSNISQEEIPGNESVLLLPEDPDGSARQIRDRLESSFGVQIGVLIIDSHGRAWRKGTVGISIGFSGLPGVVDLRGEPDLFGFQLQVTEIGAADELAGAASLLMGQAGEGFPVVRVRGFPYQLREGSFSELPREKESDLFR
jgi:coenzyme F420-0:L-glutamate ligase/coenzyme F420-1:gamma-L-glutamate ligase